MSYLLDMFFEDCPEITPQNQNQNGDQPLNSENNLGNKAPDQAKEDEIKG